MYFYHEKSLNDSMLAEKWEYDDCILMVGITYMKRFMLRWTLFGIFVLWSCVELL